MNAGNQLRRELGNGDASPSWRSPRSCVAAEASRPSASSPEQPPEAMAYILRSLKHQDEIALLRQIYRERFVCVGGGVPREERIKRLAGLIADSHGSTERHECEREATRLAQRDEAEEEDEFATARTCVAPSPRPTSSSTPPTGRWPANSSTAACGPGRGTRSPPRRRRSSACSTPTRPACARPILSRQVGAAITIGSDVVAVGSNEVPAFGGGAYWTGQAGDARDFQLGQDANAQGAGRGDRGGPQRPDRRRLAAARQVRRAPGRGVRRSTRRRRG